MVQVEKNDSYQGIRFSDAANGLETLTALAAEGLPATAAAAKTECALRADVAFLKACPDTNRSSQRAPLPVLS